MLKLVKKDRLTGDKVEVKYLDLTNVEVFDGRLAREDRLNEIYLDMYSVKNTPKGVVGVGFKGEVTQQYDIEEKQYDGKITVKGIRGTNKQGIPELVCYPSFDPEGEYLYELYVMNSDGKTIDVIR